MTAVNTKGRRLNASVLYVAASVLLGVGCHHGAASQLPPNATSTVVAPNSAADTLLVDLSTLSPPPIVAMRYATANNFTGAPIPGYEANRAFLRREAAAAFQRASAALLRRGYRLEVWDAYRPVRATDAMVTWTQRTGRTDLLRDGYIASRSRHNLGLAVDCTLVDSTGRELDMGTGFDTFSKAAHTYTATGHQLANRLILRDAMARAGFVPYDDEWWHFAFVVPDAPRFDMVIR